MSGRIDIESLCAAKGLRITDQRRVIARVLSDADNHPDVEDLHRRAAAIDPRISIATVYRTVRLFEEYGVLERHDFRNGRSRYERKFSMNSHCSARVVAILFLKSTPENLS